jgi:hypothetical protein
MSMIPHELLPKIGLFIDPYDDIEEDEVDPYRFKWIYMPDAIDDINAFEQNFLALMDNETDKPGV